MRETSDYRVRAADGVEITLHRVRDRDSAGPAVLLMPGTFSSRVFWLGSRGQGLANALARAGFDSWVVEQRGRDQDNRPRSWTMNDWIAFDAPAAAQLILNETGGADFFWLGHSAGGVVGAAYSGSGLPGTDRLGGLVLLGSPGPGTMAGARRIAARIGHLRAAVLPWMSFSGRTLGLGPLEEPAGLVREWLGWNLGGAWRDGSGGDYLARLPAVSSPVLAVAGTGDHWLAPPASVRDLLDRFGSTDRTLLVAGKSTGFSEDFDHAGLVIGRTARAEIWPHILQWLTARGGLERAPGQEADVE